MTERAAVDRHQIAINTIRFLAVDMVEKANSGHPGAPMGLAPLAYTLWTRHLRQNPADPTWPNRDRFVLSCGHASTLLYSLLHLSGHELPLEELQNFRQWGSKTPGHPERDPATGVEMTTGPLGQGLSTAVGMAIAERMLATTFNREGFPVIDHRVWVVASDGDMMEGIASEASSLAAHLGLGRLTVLYDDNKISIDGPTSLSFSEDVGKRYEAYGWHVQRVEDGNDLEALDAAMTAAVVEDERPSFIVVRTHIAYGSPNKQDTASSHGAPLGADEVRATKEALDWPLEPTFHVPDEAREAFRETREQGARLEDEWNELFGRYQKTEPELAAQFRQWLDGELPAGWEERIPTFAPADGPLATRKASGKVLNAVCAEVRQLVGGSADLTGSVNTYLDGYDEFAAAEPGGRNLHFGVREHAMGAILNGMALSGMLRPYGGTFLIFSDYMRPAIRLAAMMELPVIYVFTHDSIFLGEDGPTHQPVSQLLSLRSIPGLTVIRPADANETAAAWQCAIDRQNGPTALALTRHKLPVLDATGEMARQGVARGAYVIADPPEGEPQVILIASGSEVSLALEAQARLIDDGIAARVVSMPSWELFDAQDRSYRESVLPPFIDKRLAIEAGTPLGWERYVGNDGATLGVEGFGASAPYKALADHYGFTVNEVVQRVLKIL
ncbi:MAG: transketolase [Thermoanaerobaculia bacterium]